MGTIRAKVFEFEGGIAEDGRLTAEEGAEPIVAGEGWSPDHLLLAALCRCSLSSLRHFAKRLGAEVTGSGHAHGAVTAREEDGRYAFVSVDVRMDVQIDPAPPAEDLPTLIARAEAGCFVGASLRAKPAYRWRVNGVEVAPA